MVPAHRHSSSGIGLPLSRKLAASEPLSEAKPTNYLWD
jgi:hypothetical protein